MIMMSSHYGSIKERFMFPNSTKMVEMSNLLSLTPRVTIDG